MTTPGKSDSAPAKAPNLVNVAFWLAIAGLSIIVIIAVLALAAKEQSIAFSIENQNPPGKFTPEQIRQAITMGVWLNLGFSVVFGLLAAYFIRQVRAGDRKARVRFTIVAVLMTLLLYLLGSPVIALIGLLAVLVSVGLLFTGSVTRYLNEESS